MADHLNPEQRHLCMSHIRGKDTSPEMIVRRYLHAEGFRYSLHKSSLPGKPDIVLKRYHTVVLVNGCFWHGHCVQPPQPPRGGENTDGEIGHATKSLVPCPYFKLPNTNADFWRHKIELNQARDYRERVELELLGWRVLVIWECELKSSVRDKTLNKLKNKILTLKSKNLPFVRHYTEVVEPLLHVAEDEG